MLNITTGNQLDKILMIFPWIDRNLAAALDIDSHWMFSVEYIMVMTVVADYIMHVMAVDQFGKKIRYNSNSKQFTCLFLIPTDLKAPVLVVYVCLLQNTLRSQLGRLVGSLFLSSFAFVFSRLNLVFANRWTRALHVNRVLLVFPGLSTYIYLCGNNKFNI
uniref:Transmembrane protein 138 n=1 Tax=Steinernema glaseri TaxID=37863 RepID=A0A1I7ZTK1_9BILA